MNNQRIKVSIPLLYNYINIFSFITVLIFAALAICYKIYYGCIACIFMLFVGAYEYYSDNHNYIYIDGTNLEIHRAFKSTLNINLSEIKSFKEVLIYGSKIGLDVTTIHGDEFQFSSRQDNYEYLRSLIDKDFDYQKKD